jgi:hypothetical protein
MRSRWQRYFRRPTLAELADEAACPRDVCRAVRRWVAYRQDRDGDDLAAPAVTLSRGYGDCEDFSSLISTACTMRGWRATRVRYYGNFGAMGHEVAEGRFQGEQWVSSNGSYDRITTDDDVRDLIARTLRTSRALTRVEV